MRPKRPQQRVFQQYPRKADTPLDESGRTAPDGKRANDTSVRDQQNAFFARGDATPRMDYF